MASRGAVTKMAASSTNTVLHFRDVGKGVTAELPLSLLAEIFVAEQERMVSPGDFCHIARHIYVYSICQSVQLVPLKYMNHIEDF